MKMRKRGIVYVLLSTLVVGSVVGSLMINNSLKEKELIPVSNPILDKVIPVSTTAKEIVRPYTDATVTILSGFYDYKDESTRQINSIVFYDNTYMQNTGNIYASDNKFDVVSIADGEVIKVEDSQLFGKIVMIKHSDNLTSVYQFLEDTTVSPNKMIKQGEKIGVSGVSNIIDNTKNQLYFELLVHDTLVDAENYYGKNINEI